MTSFMGNAKEAKKIDPDIDLGIPDAFHLDQLDEHKMTANEVVQFYNPEMMGQIFENTQHLVNLLDKAEEGVFSRYLKANSSEDSRNDFDFGHPKTEDNASDDADPFGFGPNKPIFSSTYIKNLKRGTRSHFKSPHFLKNKFGSSPKREENAGVSRKVLNAKLIVILRVVMCHFGNAIVNYLLDTLLISHRMILR